MEGVKPFDIISEKIIYKITYVPNVKFVLKKYMQKKDGKMYQNVNITYLCR